MKQRHFYLPSCPLPFANHQQGGMENSRVSKRSSGSLLYNGKRTRSARVDLEQETDLPKRFPVRARFIEKVMHGCDHKGILVKGQLRAAGAHHVFEGEKLSSGILEIAHYKWITGAIDRLKSAIQLVKEAGIPVARRIQEGAGPL